MVQQNKWTSFWTNNNNNIRNIPNILWTSMVVCGSRPRGAKGPCVSHTYECRFVTRQIINNKQQHEADQKICNEDFIRSSISAERHIH